MQNPTVKKEKKLTDLHPQDEQSVRENNTQVQHELQGGVQITNGWVNIHGYLPNKTRRRTRAAPAVHGHSQITRPCAMRFGIQS